MLIVKSPAIAYFGTDGVVPFEFIEKKTGLWTSDVFFWLGFVVVSLKIPQEHRKLMRPTAIKY